MGADSGETAGRAGLTVRSGRGGIAPGSYLKPPLHERDPVEHQLARQVAGLAPGQAVDLRGEGETVEFVGLLSLHPVEGATDEAASLGEHRIGASVRRVDQGLNMAQPAARAT